MELIKNSPDEHLELQFNQSETAPQSLKKSTEKECYDNRGSRNKDNI